MEIKFNSIGIVVSPIKEGIDRNWGGVVSQINVDNSYSEGLMGLNKFSHAVIVYFMHGAAFNAESDLQRKPQGREDMPLIGIFSQRAKHRPNPIGITAVEILSVEKNILKVKGLDAIDGTPVLDIKPYFPAYDMKPAVTPDWVDKLMKGYF